MRVYPSFTALLSMFPISFIDIHMGHAFTVVPLLPSSSLPRHQQQRRRRRRHASCFMAPVEKKNNEFMDSIGKAALQVGSDFFVALRWGAANALTAALPEDQRKVLLERMDPEPPKYIMTSSSSSSTSKGDITTTTTDDDQEVLIKNSVNEAVAAAVAVQSQREKKWEQEKEQILVLAEQAATKRVATDFAIQKQRFEEEQRLLRESDAQIASLELEVEKATVAIQATREFQAKEDALKKELNEKEAQLRDEMATTLAAAVATAAARTNETASATAAPSSSSSSSVWDTNGGASQQQKQQQQLHPDTNNKPHHSVLGPIIQDLGYKRLHLVSAATLATIPVWKKQRIYRHERAKAMAADKLKTLHLGLPGVICLHEESNGKLSILDGQHRVGMMKIIQEKLEQINTTATTTTIDLNQILVEVYPQTTTTTTTDTTMRSADHAQDIFMEINKAEPIKLVDMPGVASSKDRNLISQAVYRLEDEFPTMFSPSQRCRAPNVNVDNLRDNIFAANIIKRHNLKSAPQLVDWLISQNDRLEQKYATDLNAQAEVSVIAWKKASSNQFYLGLESSWLYN